MKTRSYGDELFEFAGEFYAEYRDFDDGTNDYENEAFYYELKEFRNSHYED